MTPSLSPLSSPPPPRLPQLHRPLQPPSADLVSIAAIINSRSDELFHDMYIHPDQARILLFHILSDRDSCERNKLTGFDYVIFENFRGGGVRGVAQYRLTHVGPMCPLLDS